MLNSATGSGASGNSIVLQMRVRYVQLLLVLVTIGTLLAFISGILSDDLLALGSILAPVLIVAVTLLYLVSRQRFLTLSVGITLLLLLVLSFGISEEPSNALLLVGLLTFTSISTALLAAPFFFWIMQGMIGLRLLWHVLVVLVAAPTLTEGLATHLSGFVLIALTPIAAGAVIRVFTNALESTTKNAQRNARLLQASADVGQIMAQVLDRDVLLARAVDIIRDRFGFYHVQIFLLDEDRRYAVLQASTGDVGERMLARGHRILIDSRSVIGRVVQAVEPIVASDTANDSDHSPNELLPSTRSELALPITDGKDVLGALDVQSTRPNAFTDEEMRALNVITIQLATAMRNARLFEQQEQNVRENKRLFIESEMSLREIQRLNRQLTQQAWGDYLETRQRARGLTLRDGDIANEMEWTERMKQARLRRRPISEREGDVIVTAVPIELQGEVVGAIEIETPPTYDKEDLRDIMQVISQRLAISLENARLFEETQQTTAQEQRIGEIAAQYQSANTVDELLKVTLQGLAETLGAQEATIRLGGAQPMVVTSEEPHSHNGEGSA